MLITVVAGNHQFAQQLHRFQLMRHHLPRNAQKRRAPVQQLIHRQIDMPHAHCLIAQDVLERSADSPVAVRWDADGRADSVRRFEAHAVNIVAQLIRICPDDRLRPLAVHFADFQRQRRAHAVRLQKKPLPRACSAAADSPQ